MNFRVEKVGVTPDEGAGSGVGFDAGFAFRTVCASSGVRVQYDRHTCSPRLDARMFLTRTLFI